jgi:hypothetical protein
MAIVTTEDGITTFELESPEAYQQFRAGVDDNRYWRNHPETQELHTFQSENCQSSRIFVKYGEYTKRIK